MLTNSANRRIFPFVILLAVIFACYLPFIDKAFHIDDPLFVWGARQIDKNPADYFGFTVDWYGRAFPMVQVATNPPLTSYLIAFSAWINGWSEISIRSFFLIPFIGVIFGSYALAGQLCRYPLEAALVTLAAPVVLVSVSSVMCDTSMLAFWVWAVHFWLLGIKRDNTQYLLFSAMLMGCAVLTKYFGISLALLLGAYTLSHRRRLTKELWFLLVPILFLAEYEWVTYLLYGIGNITYSINYAQIIPTEIGQPFWIKLFVGLSFAGGCFTSILFFSNSLCRLQTLIFWVGLCVILIFVLSGFPISKWFPFLKEEDLIFSSVIQLAVFSTIGLGGLALTIENLRRENNPDSFLLFLWILGTLVFAVFVNWTVNGRSFLPMAPAIGILIIRKIDSLNSNYLVGSKFIRFHSPLFLSLVLAFSVSASDYCMANNAREAAKDIFKRFGGENQRIRFTGHWGFQYYMQQNGAKPIGESPLINGDLLVIAKNNLIDNKIDILEESILWKEEAKFSSFPVVITMNPYLGAGFYSHFLGPLPFAFGRIPSDHYSIIKIVLK